jgi:hypothetical protein
VPRIEGWLLPRSGANLIGEKSVASPTERAISWLGKYLALAVAGRGARTAGYLALGYAVGTDLAAASGVLTNMRALAGLCGV